MNDNRQYSMMYFPKDMIEEKQKTYWVLLDIDANFSKIIQVLLSKLRAVASFIFKKKKSYRHYTWDIVICDKETGQKYYGEDLRKRGYGKLKKEVKSSTGKSEKGKTL